jgi:hypothetical protein
MIPWRGGDADGVLARKTLEAAADSRLERNRQDGSCLSRSRA